MSIRHLMAATMAVVVTACGSTAEPAPAATDAATERGGLLADVTTVEVTSAEHLEGPIDYDQSPPVGGDHAPVWVNCGRYDGAIPGENAVHALEHGAVWLTYPADVSDDDLAVIDELVDGRSHMLASVLPDASGLTATAWGVQLAMDGVDDPALAAFVDFYHQGPQTPEPGASCEGGIGTPVG